MKKTIEQLHIAAQYLAAAGISFLNKEPDDSHTNLGWNAENAKIETGIFGHENSQMAINMKTGRLEWLRGGVSTESIDLQKKTHQDIIRWISLEAVKNGIEKQYTYQFHYDLPYSERVDNDYLIFNSDELNEIIKRLNIGQEGFENFLLENDLVSPIRIWPHHFDLGIYTSINKEETFFMGAGLAIPDSLVDDLYYYASGYDNGSAVVTKDFPKLSKGDWRTDWNGATLASSGISSNDVIFFLNEVKEGFLVDN